jgi:hypothetical protein
MHVKTRVVHCKRDQDIVQRAFADGLYTYIGRPSRWGNPFKLAKDADDAERMRVLEQYERWLREQTRLMLKLHELRGRVLGCWCAPKLCHGDVLARLADEAVP